jgi:ATPase family associated with various cellular activities (AAA)
MNRSLHCHHVWKPILYKDKSCGNVNYEHNMNATSPITGSYIVDETISCHFHPHEKDSIIFFNPTNATTTKTTSSSSSSSSSTTPLMPLFHFIRKYTNISLSTYQEESLSDVDNRNTNVSTTTTTTTTNSNKAIKKTNKTVLQVLMLELYDVLGMIRSLQYDLQLYNQSLKTFITEQSSDEQYDRQQEEDEQQQKQQQEQQQQVNDKNDTNHHISDTTIRNNINLQNMVRYNQYRFLQQLQICCPTNRIGTIELDHKDELIIDGLNELILYIEEYYKENISLAQEQITIQQQITFTSMMEYCQPGTILIDTTGLISGSYNSASSIMGVKCRSNRYRRNKTISGHIVSTHETSIEFIIALGTTTSLSSTSSSNYHHNHDQTIHQPQYAIIETIWIQSEFDNVRSIQYSTNNDNPYNMLLLPNTTILSELYQRGVLYQSYCGYPSPLSSVAALSGVFVNYIAGSFYPCHGTVRTSSKVTSGQPSRVGGRIMIDLYQSWIRGIHICKPPVDHSIASDQIVSTLQSYARHIRQTQKVPLSTTNSNTSTNPNTNNIHMNGPDDILVLYGPNIIDELVCMTYPVVCGFSFESRNWGIVYVDGLTPITFHDTIFASTALVLSSKRKRLLRAIVSCHGRRTTATTTSVSASSSMTQPSADTTDNAIATMSRIPLSADVLPGKGEGLIILLYGPPGVGKTLTAEAVAEVLQRPLYRVSMGELGTTPEHLEERLQDIFDLCIPWQAIVLIDEAEILLKERTSNDLLRNAMVCVMLRLLEYYPGILFLTTNSSIDQLDPAIASRITVALEYKALDIDSRKEIWKNCISRILVNNKNVDTDDTTFNILSDESLTTLSTIYHTMNGRQIKNAVQLASIVCQYEQQPLTLENIQDVIEMTTSPVVLDPPPNIN